MSSLTAFISPLKRRPLEAAIVALVAVMYLPLLGHWVEGWLNKSISIQHEYFSHGLIGIPFAVYLAWLSRAQWMALPDHWHCLGPILVAIAGGFYLSGLPDWLNLSFPIMLVGLCLCLKGMAGLKLEAFPLVLIALATPTQMPYLIEPYVLPLQHFIASVAGFLLQLAGLEVTVEQIYLFVNGQTVEVAPHCAGLKMLFTSLYVALMLIYWTGLHTSRLRIGVFLGGTVLISVAGNIVRNALLSYFHGTGQTAAFDWLHESWGGDLYSAILLLSLLGWLQGVRRLVPVTLNLKIDSNSTV